MRNQARAISQIALDIQRCWPKPSYTAAPYITAMRTLDKVEDFFMHDSARDILLRFLSNAGTWKGEDAKRIKAEIKEMLK